MPLRPRHALLAAVLLAAAGRDAQGQPVQPDEGPVVVGERKEGWKSVELKSFGAAIEINTRYRAEQLKQQGQDEISETELRQREYLDLNGEVFFGHKNLVDLTGDVQLGLESRFLDSSVVGDTDGTDFTDLFNLNALVFGNSFVPTNVYARRDESILDQNFAGSVDILTTEVGIVSNIRSTVAPTTVRLFHLEYDQSDLLGTTSSSLDQNTIAVQSNITIASNHKLDVNATVDQIHQTQNNDFENDPSRIDVLFTDTYTFGRQGSNSLRSYLRYYSEAGDFPYESLRWDEQLLLVHSDTLETRYNSTVERLDHDGDSQSLARGDANIRHRLFDSLVSNGTIGGQYLTASDDFTSTDLFAIGQLEYTKMVSVGRLDAGANLGLNFQQNSDRGGTLSITNEPHIYDQPFPIVLPRRNIVEGSIVMTGVGGFPTYQDGTDYTVAYFPDRAEVTIVLGRGIADGQTLLFDYELGPEPGSDINSLDTGLTFRYTFTETWARGLSFYTSYRTRNSNVNSPDPEAIVVDNTQILIYGAEYRRAGITLRAEQELRQSNVNPYDTTRLQALYDLLIGPGSTLAVDLTYDLIEYQEPANQVTFGRISARWDQRLLDSLYMNLRLEVYQDQDDLTGDSIGFAQHIGFRWRYRQTSLFAEFHNTSLDSDTSDQASQAFELGLRRDF